MDDAAFLLAALPEPVCLLHQALEPFSLGHEFLLRRHGNRFRCPELGELPSLEDLFMGVFVCSQNYDDATKALRSPDLEATLSKWVALCGKFDPKPLLNQFAAYLADGTALPKFRRIKSGKKKGISRTPGAPWPSLIFHFLTRRLGFSPEDALNAPLGLAQWLYCIDLEADGKIKIVDRKDEETSNSIREKFAELGLKPLIV